MSKNYSIIRAHEYQLLQELELDGLILDVGGSTKSGYHQLIKGENEFHSFNINPDYGCDIVGDVEGVFPLEDSVYDHAVCLNLLEHVYEFDNVIAETARVLRSGGTIVSATPFMFQIHGSPDDYFRYTPSALRHLLAKHGFTNIVITPLGYGLFSLIFQITGGVLPGFCRVFLQKTSVFLDKALLRFAKYRVLRDRIPLGYFVSATKQ